MPERRIEDLDARQDRIVMDVRKVLLVHAFADTPDQLPPEVGTVPAAATHQAQRQWNSDAYVRV
jgi:hypothetical protein